MKVRSIWQPFASLIVNGHKFFETAGWPAPKSIIGETIGIASTKRITSDQRHTMSNPDFRHYYDQTGLPELDDLPHGYLLGTAFVHSCELITEDWIDDVTDEEKMFGWWTSPDNSPRYAWRLRYAKAFEHPIPIRGKQGIFEWKGLDARPTETLAFALAEAGESISLADFRDRRGIPPR